MSGYVRLHRTLLGHPAFRNDAEAMAFAWMVAKAAWKPTKVRYKGHDITLQRGQLTISIRDFADALDRPKGWVERLFARLREHGMIEQKNGTQVGTQVGTHGGTIGGTPANVITICNYAQFQAEGASAGTAGETPDGTRTGQRQDTEQVREEVKNTPSGVARPRAKTSFPIDWTPPPIDSLTPKARDCAKQWTAASYATVAEAFACYWQRTGRMNKDWRLTWCEWVIKEHSKVMRDQKFGNAAPSSHESQSLTGTQWRERAEFFDKIGNRDSAAECRRKAAELEQRAA